VSERSPAAGDGPLAVRPLEQRDLDAAADLLVEAALCGREGLAERLGGAIGSASGRCLAAEQESRLVGVLLASYNGFHVFLSHLAVAPGQRRRGIGARLHDELARLARRDGARGIIVDARLSAVGFFEALGYRTPGAVFLIRDVGD
jgi:GNAT superfamily N-acetyltransferase